MTCRELERWIDEGSSAEAAVEARAHAATCERCAAALEAAAEIERLLETSPLVAAPAGFTDRVIARIAEAHAPRVLPTPSDMPWWIEAAAQPASALAAAVAGLMLWQRDAIEAAGANLTRVLVGVRLPESPTLAPSFQQTDVLIGLTIVAVPAAAWAAWKLYRWSARLAAPHATHR